MGVGTLLLVVGLLVAITIPNLRREVAPPEISGPEQVERNTAKSSAPPTSRTLTVASPTSATQPLLNLDDFPHLSPKMRELAQAWLDQCSETNKALDAIADPTLRAQASACLKDRDRMRAFLNRPLNWDGKKFQLALHNMLWWKFETPYGPNSFPLSEYLLDAVPPGEGFEDQCRLFDQCPEFKNAFRMELYGGWALNTRMTFEYNTQSGLWNNAALTFLMADKMRRGERMNFGPRYRELYEVVSWDEEVYCMRQMGGRGLAMLTASSYSHALKTHLEGPMGNRPENTYADLLRAAGDLALAATTINMGVTGD